MNAPRPNLHLEAALGYARLGWPVFPIHGITALGHCTCPDGEACQDAGKHPRNLHGLSDASTGENIIRGWWRQWPGANVGIRTDGLVVIDIDPRHGGDTTLDELVAEHGRSWTDTVTGLTGGGGQHLIFRAPPGSAITNGTAVLGPGIDIRANGGYIIAPPSSHKSGGIYRWEEGYGPTEREPADLPGWMADQLGAASTAAGRRLYLVMRDGVDLGGVLEGIPEGERANSLFRAAAKMRRVDLPFGVARRIIAEAAANARPAFPEDEAVKAVESAYRRYQPTPAAVASVEQTDFKRTDLGNAERLISTYGDDIRFVHQWGWLFWDGARWTRDTIGRVEQLAKQTVRAIWLEAAATEDEEARKALAAHAARSESAAKVAALLKHAESDPAVRANVDNFDAAPLLFNCTNGTLDLETGELRPHSRGDLITKLGGVAFAPDARCPQFDRWIAQVLANNTEVIDFLQRAMGYALTGDVSEQVLFFLYGAGANGKSTFINIFLDLLGDYGTQAAPELLLAKKHENHPTETADIAGSRLVACTEIDEGRRLAESFVKQLTGGDRLKARLMRQDFFEFRATHKIVLAANHKPVIRGTDNAIWRRMRLIPFTVTFPPDRQDRRLPQKLRGELPGILRWAVEGALKWRQSGLGLPNDVRAATDEYRVEMDVLAGFLADCCVIKDDARTSAKDLRTAYVQWCEQTGERIESQRRIGMQMTERGFARERARDGYYWAGLGLVTTATPSGQRESSERF